MRFDTRKVVVAIGVIVVVAVAGVLLWPRVTPVLGQSLPLAQPFSIGYVDMPRALDSHPRRASSERALQEFFQAKQREFQERSRNMTAFQRQELDRQLQQQIVEKRNELLGGLDREIRSAVERAAQEAGMSVVLDRAVVLYGGTDLTDAVITKIKGR
jgi:outer membrane protein